MAKKKILCHQVFYLLRLKTLPFFCFSVRKSKRLFWFGGENWKSNVHCTWRIHEFWQACVQIERGLLNGILRSGRHKFCPGTQNTPCSKDTHTALNWYNVKTSPLELERLGSVKQNDPYYGLLSTNKILWIFLDHRNRSDARAFSPGVLSQEVLWRHRKGQNMLTWKANHLSEVSDICSACFLRFGLFFLSFFCSFSPSFLSGCCMAQRRSLFGRSPFCQRKLSEESQIQWKSVSLKATTLTT